VRLNGAAGGEVPSVTDNVPLRDTHPSMVRLLSGFKESRESSLIYSRVPSVFGNDMRR